MRLILSHIIIYDSYASQIGKSNIDGQSGPFIVVMRVRLPSFIWISVFFLLLVGYSEIMSGIDAHASADRDRQSVDCSPSSSGGGSENDIDGDSGNIEEQIPSVIPFP